jgi:hypothetical protein
MNAFHEAVRSADNQNHHNGSDNHPDQPSAAPERWPRPPVQIRNTITLYAESELIQLLKWIASDSQLRADDEIMDEMTSTLGFSRRRTYRGSLEKSHRGLATAIWTPGLTPSLVRWHRFLRESGNSKAKALNAVGSVQLAKPFF